MPLPLILGAVALGTAVFGAKKGYDGYQKHSEADDIVKAAQGRYDGEKLEFDKVENKTTTALDILGRKELEIGESIGEFQTLAQKLIEKLNKSLDKKLEINIPKNQQQKIENYSYTATGVIGSIVGAGAAAAAAGFAVYGGVMALGSASTGTAISSLAGAAATRAALAALGGGSLATGGMGIAGGTVILGATIVAPVLAIAGWAYDNHGEKSLKNAKEADENVTTAIEKMNRAIEHLNETIEYARKIKHVLTSIHGQFYQYFNNLEKIDSFLNDIKSRGLNTNDEIAKLGEDTVQIIGNGYALASILVDLISTPIFKFKKLNGDIVKNEDDVPELERDGDGFSVLNGDELKFNLEQATSKADKF
ncbi:MAG: chemotaxis protein [Burkholderiaceae bacterium]|nr:chemotaxis protein [Burkholderiaceae bacterium]